MPDEATTHQRNYHQLKSNEWTRYHFTVFVLTFSGYACYHATRKTFSNVKKTMQDEWTPTFCNATVPQIKPDNIWNSHHMYADKDGAEYFFGILDTLFLLAYALGLFIGGFIGDRLDMRKVLAAGMCSSAICVSLLGVISEWSHIYHTAWYIAWWTLNGLLQASGWPAMVAVMANWFGKSSRGLIMGIWSSCASVGNIIGTVMVAGVLQYGYEYAFLVPSCTLFAAGIVVYFGLVPHPREVGLRPPDLQNEYQKGDSDESAALLDESQDSTSDDDVDDGEGKQDEVSIVPNQQPQQAMGFFKAMLLPGVIPYSLAYACLKLVNYAFFFWLPFYFTNAFNWDQSLADKMSIWYDVGGIVGGILAGIISDRMGVRSPIVVLFLLGSVPALYGYSKSPSDQTTNAVLLAVVGFFIGGPANMISSAISADLGRQGALQSNKEALATVAGMVDGTGSIGGAIGQGLVPVIQLHLGWHWVFYCFILLTLLTALCISRIFVREMIIFIDQCESRWRSNTSPVQ